MKVLLIAPDYPNLPKIRGNPFNVGLGYLTGSLKAASHEVKVLDFTSNPNDMNRRLEDALADEPDIVGISVTSGNFPSFVSISKKVSAIHRPKLLIAGGPQICLFASVDELKDEILKFIKQDGLFDVAVVGEGEKTIIELCDVVEGKRRLEDIKGIIYTEDDKIVVTPKRQFTKDLDSLTYPDYSVFDSLGKEIIEYSILTSRGCPYNCSFCKIKFLAGRKWRARDPHELIKELKHAKNKYNVGSFVIVDDNFAQDLDRAKLFCTLLKENKIGLPWRGLQIRADGVDEELLLKMKETGCTLVGFGVESADSEVFNAIGKGCTLEQIEEGIKLAKKAGLLVNCFFVIGLPGSTYESEMKSVEFVRRLNVDFVLYCMYGPSIGTPAYDWFKKNGRYVRNDLNEVDIYKGMVTVGLSVMPVFETDEFTKEEQIKAYYTCNVRLCQFGRVSDHKLGLVRYVIQLMYMIGKYGGWDIPRIMWILPRKALKKMYIINHYRPSVK